MSLIEISQVRNDEIEDACSIMIEAAEWLIQKGSPLWNVNELGLEKMQPYANRGELFFAKLSGKPAGTIILQEEDPFFWPEVTDGNSLFFHKLAVRREFAGTEVSKALIEFATKIGISKDKSYVRMDCSAKHPKLRPFYESHGFQFVDQRQAGPWFVDRLEKKIR